jgi:hypothetical protein
MHCQGCRGDGFTREGQDRRGRQVYRDTDYMRRLMEDSTSAFVSFRFPVDVIGPTVVDYARRRGDEPRSTVRSRPHAHRWANVPFGHVVAATDPVACHGGGEMPSRTRTRKRSRCARQCRPAWHRL